MSLPTIRTCQLALLLTTLLLSPAVVATDETSTIPESEPARPKVGLVLSGGGARGAAHIGVLRELERQNVPVDFIVGTSMGAIIGGLYASGLDVDRIEQAMRDIDWNTVFNDATDRRELTIRRKRDNDFFQLDKDAGISETGLELPTGLIRGQKLYLELVKLTRHASGMHHFDRFPIPFRCVATDISSGEQVVLDSGNLALAMRASMAVPGVFSTVHLDDRILVDGGISNNLPIDVARDMGAEVIIASDISSPLAAAPETDSVLYVVGQLSRLLTRANVDRQLQSLGERDILITPELGDFSSSDFVDAMDIVDSGQEAAAEAASLLAQLATPSGEMDASSGNTASANSAAAPDTIGFIRIQNDSSLDESVIRERFGLETGDRLDLDVVEEGVARIYGMGIFESVSYQVIREDNQSGLQVTAREKPWGPDYLQFGFDFSSNLSDSGSATFGLGHIRIPANSRLGEWRNVLFLGQETGILSEIYQPFSQESSTFVHGSIGYRSDFYDVIDDGRAIARNRLKNLDVSLSLGRDLSSWGQVLIGHHRLVGEVETRTGEPVEEDDDLDIGELFASFNSDTLDSAGFPTTGFKSNVRLGFADPDLGSDKEFQQLYTSMTGAFGGGRDTIHLGMDVLATWDGIAPVPNRARPGGLFDFPGLTRGEITGSNLLLLKSGYMRRLGSLASMDTYAGLNLQFGNVFDAPEDIDTSDLLWSSGAWLGIDSLIGPVYLGYGVAEDDLRSVYVLIGPQF